MNHKPSLPFHHAWVILIACCALQGGTLGLIQNTCGVYYQPICDELGFALSVLTLHTTLRGLASCVVLPLALHLLQKASLRKTLSIAVCVFAATNMSMALCSEPWHWYAAGIVQGAASSVLIVITVPLILSNWFLEKQGFAIGFAMAFSGAVGMVANPVCSAIIASVGWRACYLIMGLLCLVVILPFTLFVFRFKPEDMGMTRYGEKPSESGSAQIAAPRSAGRRCALLPLLFALEIITMFCAAFCGHLPTFGASVGMQTTAAAALASFSMAGNMGGKLLLGAASDRFGPGRIALLAYLLPAIGFALLFQEGNILYAAALLIGISIPTGTVIMPLLIRETSGDERFDKTYSTIKLFGSVTYALSGTVLGVLYDAGNSTYTVAALICLGVMGLGVALSLPFLAQNGNMHSMHMRRKKGLTDS